MKYIISGTNRIGSNTLKVSKVIQQIYAAQNEQVELITLEELDFTLLNGRLYGQELPEPFRSLIQKINSSEGLIFVVPEYNGSYPGILKYFIDFWKYPDSFEKRPVCFIGLGGMFGALRPIEHLQQVFGYRNAFQFPERVFIQQVFKKINSDGSLNDQVILDLLTKQAKGFSEYCKQVKSLRG